MIYPLESSLGSVITRPILKRIDRDLVWQRDEVARCREEPWYWVVNYVYTLQKDEFAEESKPVVRRFPSIEYLRYVLDSMFRNLHLVVDKSRQMILSWSCMVYYLYWGMFGKHEQILIQTKKEEDAANLVKRVEFMLKGLRYWMQPGYSYREGAGGRIHFLHSDSEIRGIPAGVGAADQIRSANPSRYFLDEGGFIDDFSGCRACAEACCQDIKIVSTPNVGPFADFVHDGSMEGTAA
jgi:hypothetical protein